MLESYSLLVFFLMGCVFSVFKKVEDWDEFIFCLFNFLEFSVCEMMLFVNLVLKWCGEMDLNEWLLDDCEE